MCCYSIGGHSRLGISLGIIAFSILLLAFFGGSWLTTTEPVKLPDSLISTNIQFKIGLWEACLFMKRVNSTMHLPRPSCSLIKYEGWRDVTHSDFGLWMPLNLAPVFINRMRLCTVLTGSAVILLALASLLSLLGQLNGDGKTLLACGFFILGGLSLGTGLVIFATALSETFNEIMQEFDAEPEYDYRYGWCFFAGGAALILSYLAAMFSLSGYINHFGSTDEMVRQMVPGLERKFKEQTFLTNYLSDSICTQARSQYEIEKKSYSQHIPPWKYGAECGSLHNKTPPDVCATNRCVAKDDEDTNPKIAEYKKSVSNSLAGQTVPIIIKNNTPVLPVTYANFPVNKNDTVPQLENTIHQDFFGVSDVSSLGSYCSTNKTLRYHRTAKENCPKIDSSQARDTGFSEFGKKVGFLQYSGSAK